MHSACIPEIQVHFVIGPVWVRRECREMEMKATYHALVRGIMNAKPTSFVKEVRVQFFERTEFFHATSVNIKTPSMIVSDGTPYGPARTEGAMRAWWEDELYYKNATFAAYIRADNGKIAVVGIIGEFNHEGFGRFVKDHDPALERKLIEAHSVEYDYEVTLAEERYSEVTRK